MGKNIYNLTEDQLNVFNNVQEFIKSDKNLLLLQGYAGTGKSYMTIRLVYDLLINNNDQSTKSILITSPTHKALKILQDEFDNVLNNEFSKRISTDKLKLLKFNTIHSALGLTAIIDGWGKIQFKNLTGECNIDSCKILFIDESSMISNEIFELLIPYFNAGLKIIFIGDGVQIPPVNESNSIVFKSETQIKYNIQIESLVNIIRQAQDNPIIKKTFEIRNDLSNQTVIDTLFYKNEINNNSGIHILNNDNEEDNEKLANLIYSLFKSNEFKNNSDHVKIIAWRNVTVDSFNEMIRSIIYENNRNIYKIMPNEKLIVNSPIMNENNFILYNINDELTVKNYNTQFDIINYGKNRIQYYNTLVSSNNNSKKLNYIKIIHENSEKTYYYYLNTLKQKALNEKQGTEKAKMKWIEYYNFKEKYANIKYNYAITCHKAQGSSYNNVILIGYDIKLNKDVIERNRILYTACSRPRYNLYIIK